MTMTESAAAPSFDDRRRLLADALDRLDAALAERGVEELRRVGKRPPGGRDWMVLTAYDLGAPCPARAVAPRTDEYVESAPNAARRLGRLVLRRWRPGLVIGEVVDAVLADRDGWQPGLRAWFEGLDRSGRAAVIASTTTWAVGALTVVKGRSGRPDDQLTWAERNDVVEVPGWSLRLKSTWDAVLGSRRDPVALLVLGRRSRRDGDLLAAGFEALACGVAPGVVPARVSFAHPGAGSPRSVPVTASALHATVDRIAELTAYRLDPDGAPTAPGRWCRHCHLVEACPDAPVEALAGVAWATAGQGSGSTAAAG
jgi:hypothetical protein